MRKILPVLFCILPAALCGAAFPAAAQQPGDSSHSLSVAVANFIGEDGALGRFLSDTMLTALADSPRLRLLERADTTRVLEMLHIDRSDDLTAAQIREIGHLLGVRALVVGSFFESAGHLDINARLLNTRTGRVWPGGGVSVSGSADDILHLSRTLARSFRNNIAGAPIQYDDIPPSRPADPDADAPMPVLPEVNVQTLPDPGQALLPQSAPPAPAVSFPSEHPYTGLVIEAYGLEAQRNMGARILDEEGNVIYPTPNHMPEPGYVEDNGTMSYEHHRLESPRAGGHPMVVEALRVNGDDYIVDDHTAARILNANLLNHFLWNWNVTALIDQGR